MTPYAAFASRNYRFLLGALSTSMMGQQMLGAAVGWDLYEQTRSALVLGNVGFFQVLPVFLFTFIAGNVADRYDRRKTVMITQSFAAVVGMLLYLSGSHRSVLLIYTCLFLIASGRAFQWPATSSMMPHTIPKEHLTSAISWNGSIRELATVAGPAIAGYIIAHFGGGEPVYLIQSLCSAASAACISQVHVPAHVEETKARPGLQGTIEGLKFVWREKLVFWTMVLDLLAVLFGGATALMPIFATDILKVGANGLGWLLAAPSVGAGLMSLALAHKNNIGSAGKVLLGSVAGFGVFTILFGLSPYFPLSLVALFLLGAFDAISVVLRINLVQLVTPDHLRGRVNAVNALFISSSNQLGAVESGIAATIMGTVPSVVFGGTMTVLVVAGIAWAAPAMRKWKN